MAVSALTILCSARRRLRVRDLSLVFTDTLNSSFTDLFRQTAPDVTVRPARADAASASGFTGGDTRTVPAAVVATVARCPGWHGPTAS